MNAVLDYANNLRHPGSKCKQKENVLLKMELLVYFTFPSNRPRLFIPKLMQRFHEEPRAEMWKLLHAFFLSLYF